MTSFLHIGVAVTATKHDENAALHAQILCCTSFCATFLVMAIGNNNSAEFYPMLHFLKLTFSSILHFIFQTQT